MNEETHPRIILYGGCWPTNIGNAFVNLGALQSLRAALGNGARLDLTSSLSSYLFWKRKKHPNTLPFGEILRYEYVVIGGMTMCVDYWETQKPILQQFVRRGAKIIIAGGGGRQYDDEEVRGVYQAMRDLPVYAFISRDRYSYEQYRDIAEHAFDGIDSAFFVGDNFEPLNLELASYSVFTFDKFQEPRVLNQGRSLLGRTMPAASGSGETRSRPPRYRTKLGPPRPTIDLEGRSLLRTHHSTWAGDLDGECFEQPDTLLSDLPVDYLSLYSQAHTVYSDRVHACIASLAFGRAAMLFGDNEPRLRMFERVGAADILHHTCQLDMEALRDAKDRQVRFLRSVLRGE